MAAVRSALADMLSHGGGFAGESQQESQNADSDCHRTLIGPSLQICCFLQALII